MGRTSARISGSTIGMKALVALACVVVPVSSGCSTEQPTPPSGSHKESKETQGPAQNEARSGGREGTTEAAKPASKEAAEHGVAKPKPAPRPKSEPARGHVGSKKVHTAHGTAVTVSRVVDGDTIEISPAINGTEDVRLIGVDTPETLDPTEGVEPYGPQASAFAKRELSGHRVSLEFDQERVEQYGQLLAYVRLGGSIFNEELVAQGYAQASRRTAVVDSQPARRAEAAG